MIETFKTLVRSNDTLHRAAMALYMGAFFRASAHSKARRRRLRCDFSDETIDVRRGDQAVRMARNHAIYLFDIIENFDFFYDAVMPERTADGWLVDYSRPRSHHVKGFDLHPIVFPSIAEPVETTRQYLAFAALADGSVAIDLGAYSGLTSIMFRQECGPAGRVIAVEADEGNMHAARRNFEVYESHTGRRIELVEGAVWNHDDGIVFSTEGSMGSSAADIVGNRTGGAKRVASFTLSTLAERCDLDRVDFIKCDIEGGEAMIFDDPRFFARFRPRMIVEAHLVAGRMTIDAVREALGRHRYEVRTIRQDGMDLPLLECRPL